MSTSVYAQFESVARTHPTSVALETESESVTYETLANQVSAIADRLRAQALPPRSIIALVFSPEPDYVAAVLGTLAAGHVFMPVAPGFPVQRIADLVSKAESPLCLVSGAHTEKGIELQNALEAHPDGQLGSTLQSNGLTSILRLAATSVAEPGARHSTQSAQHAEDACYVMATSGSTGRPKMILGSARGLSHFINWEIRCFGFSQNARCSFLSNVSFDVSLRDMLAPLLSGGTVCIPSDSTRVTPNRLLDWLERERLTHIHIVPTLLRGLLAGPAENAERLPALRYALIAGEPLYVNDVANWRARLNRKTQLVNLYGPSETTLAKFYHEIGEIPSQPGEMIPVGQPLPDTELLILNDHHQPCAANQTGEVYIGTPYMSVGYLNAPEEQVERFVTLSAAASHTQVFYRTGDLGRVLQSGELQLEGRKDGQVKLHGNRIELAEVEAAIRFHPEVLYAAAAVKTDDLGNHRLVGYIVPKASKIPSSEALRTTVAAHVPDYMVPALFLSLDELPLTHSNKVDRSALPDPPKTRPELGRESVPPRTATEKSLVDIWRRILDLDEVGIDDAFFELGGTSMLAVHLVGAIEAELGFDAPATAVLQHPTVRQLAQLIDGTANDSGVHALINERANKRKSAMRRRRTSGTREQT